MLPLKPRLDHVVINVLEDLDAAAERYQRLGFSLTPRGHHTLGTSNNLAIFGTDYLELLGYEKGKAGSRVDLVNTLPGLSGLVFKPPADADFSAALNAAGVQADPPREFSRPVDLPGGPQDARFRTVNLSNVVEGGRVFFCHHYTPELVWRPEWQNHANRARAITAFTIATADPARTARPFARMFGAEALRPADGGLVLTADGAEIRFMPHAAAVQRLGDAIVPDEGVDRMVALEFRTASLEATRAVLDGVGLVGPGLTVPAREACGVALSFVA